MPGNEIAVVGYSARLPGAENADEAWRALVEGRCTVSEVPPDRFSLDRFFDPQPGTPGKSYTFRAGVISDPFHFDAADFGISPLEAQQMDPQQRLLLEGVAHAFDHAGIDPATLAGERTGVFVGASSADHSIFALQDPRQAEAHFMLGNTLSILANRVSFQWDFGGPSFTIDTACSSGLFALDQAVQAISRGAIDAAVVAGVNLLLSPLPFIGFSQARMLSPDGLCRPFSQGANGYVRSEGVVVFILRRADLARASGDRIRSVILGSATNNDGHTSGIAFPSARSQQRLLEETLSRLAVDPEDIAFFEAHGTGTAVGDPVEARAIGLSYGSRRRSPLAVGSAKGNFGHLEPTSGLVGLLKAQLALEHGVVPATLHAEALNASIDFRTLNIEVTRHNLPIDTSRPCIAAINSFGFGGANAHVLIRRDPEPVSGEPAMPGDLPALRLSASSAAALSGLASVWRSRLKTGSVSASHVANANNRAPRRRLRLCVPAGPAATMAADLGAWAEGGKSARVLTGKAGARNARVGFVFGGNGSVWAGMARAIHASDATFRKSLGRTSGIFRRLGGIDVAGLLFADDLEDRLGTAEVDQPLLFAVQVALVSALRSRGLMPHAVAGHSVGEVAAAVAAGALTVETAAGIILARSRRLEALRGEGTMAALAATPEVAGALIRSVGCDAEIAAENSPESVTVTGPDDAIDALLAAARQQRIAGRRLRIDYPYHSSAIDALESEMRSDLDDVAGRPPRIAFYSTCLGEKYSGALDDTYWWKNARHPVRFADAVGAMSEDGVRLFVEITPSPVLQSYIRDTLGSHGQEAPILTGLDRTARDAEAIALEALAWGAEMDSGPLLGKPAPLSTDLPLYPFDRSQYRLTYDQGLNALGDGRPSHPLLGENVVAEGQEWRNELSVAKLPWIADHDVDGRIVLPATAILEMMAEAARQGFGIDSVELSDVEFMRPVFLASESSTRVRVYREPSLGKVTLQTWNGEGWQTHAVGRAARCGSTGSERLLLDWGDNPKRLYDALAAAGLRYGPAFRQIQSVAYKESQIDVRLKRDAGVSGLSFDPVLADAPLHAAALIFGDQAPSGIRMLLPARIQRWRHHAAERIAGARLTVREANREQVLLDVAYVGAEGAPVAEISGLRLSPARFSQKPEAQFWGEERILVASEKVPRLQRFFDRMLSDEAEETGDLEALRASIGERLAWDRLQGGSEDEDPAAGAIVRAGGLTGREPDCPLPEIGTLVDLLARAVPTATDELQSVLASVSVQNREAPVEVERLKAAALALVRDAPVAKARVAMIGALDAGLLAAVGARAAFAAAVTLSAGETEALGYQLAPEARVAILPIEQVGAGGRFDLVVGIDLARRLTGRQGGSLAALLATGGTFASVEEAPDPFSLMTGRHATSRALTSLKRMLGQSGLAARERYMTGHAPLRILTTGRVSDSPARRPAFRIVGQSRLADCLRQAGDPEGAPLHAVVVEACADLWETSLALWRIFRSLPQGDTPLWVIQDGLVGANVLRGWRRAFVNETGRDIRAASVAQGASPEFVAGILAETGEQELVFDGAVAHAFRLRRKADAPATGTSLALSKSPGKGVAGLAWKPVSRQGPGRDEIEVRVTATGLNFRDLMWAQDLLPYEAVSGGFAGPSLGMECAGQVMRAGPESGFKVGQRVMLVAPQAFATHVTVPSVCAIALPDTLSDVTAAGLPVAFTTALYALKEAARLESGESVLIHAAAGGVGLAAVQVAQHLGARIFATAGSPQKRAFLKAMGVEEVHDSRSLDFADAITVATAGRGVDVVLNSLSGAAMERSIGCLAAFGRFVELGKRDFYANTPLPLRPLRNNITYFGVDIDGLFAARTSLVERLFGHVETLFRDGAFDALPTQVFECENVRDAFGRMQSARHVGKIVVRPPDLPKRGRKNRIVPIRGTWMIVGGTQGFGLRTAGWLAERGARTIWLVSRSGRVSAHDEAALRDLPAEIRIGRCDVSEAESVEALIAEIEVASGRLSGVVHAAMELRDKPVGELSEADVVAVMAPKILGAEALDRLTRGHDLDHFWLFGSVAGRFGSRNQAPYVAANLALEEIAERRRQHGLAGLAIAWGPIGDVGYLARETGLRDLIEQELGPCMSSAEALSALSELLAAGYEGPTVTIAPSVTPGSAPAVLDGALMSEVRCLSQAEERAGRFDLAGLLLREGAEAARKALLVIMRGEAARIMRTAPDEIDADRPLNEIGFDSLMGVNFLLGLERQLGRPMAVPDGSVSLTLHELASRILASAREQDSGLATGMAARHLSKARLSEQQIEDIRRLADDVGDRR